MVIDIVIKNIELVGDLHKAQEAINNANSTIIKTNIKYNAHEAEFNVYVTDRIDFEKSLSKSSIKHNYYIKIVHKHGSRN